MIDGSGSNQVQLTLTQASRCIISVSCCANVVKCRVLITVAGEGGAGMVHADIFGTVQGMPLSTFFLMRWCR